MSDSNQFDAGPLPKPAGDGARPHDTYVHGHHWRSRHEEADGAKLGMWLFLSTELLLFAGFFCAYAAFRLMYPDNWKSAAEYYLNWKIGFLNTCVLLLSSWTIVMAIRSLQLDRKVPALIYLGITNLCAVMFLVVKLGWEYWPKWKLGELPGKYFNYPNRGPADQEMLNKQPAPEAPAPLVDAGSSIGDAANTALASVMNHAPVTADVMTAAAAAGGDGHDHVPGMHDHIFLSVYWIATATHGVHVLIGVIMISYVMLRTWRNEFGPRRFTMVENVGLYWHVVDLIWIFLFPLLYLA